MLLRRTRIMSNLTTFSIWSTFKKLNSTPWSEHVEEALDTLQKAQELPSDLLLVYLAKGQRLLESVELGLGMADPDSSNAESAAHVVLFVSEFTQDLKQMRSNMPDHIKDNS